MVASTAPWNDALSALRSEGEIPLVSKVLVWESQVGSADSASLGGGQRDLPVAAARAVDRTGLGESPCSAWSCGLLF